MALRCNRCPYPITDDEVAHLVWRDGVSPHPTPSFDLMKPMEVVCDGCLRDDEEGFTEEGAPYTGAGPQLPQLDFASWQLLELVADGVRVYRTREKWYVVGQPEGTSSVTWLVTKLKAARLVSVYKVPRNEWKHHDHFSWLLMTEEGDRAVNLYRLRQLEGAGHGVG